jgi:hypothetical protein
MAQWLQIPDFKNYETNDKCHVAFIANEAGQRRHVLKPVLAPIIKSVFDAKPIVSNKPKNKTIELYSFIDEAVKPEMPSVPSAPLDKKHTRALAYKDPKSIGPDLYLLELMDGTQIGSLALRSMPLRLELRRLVETKDKVPVSIVWYEPFQKYELKSIV